jgi:cell division transport system permease protein
MSAGVVTFKRIVRSGFVNFWRNSFVSAAAIFVMVVTLFVIGSLIFLSAILDSALEQIKDKVDVNVYFLTTASEEDIARLKESLLALPDVRSVEYTTREKALEEFKIRQQGDQLILQALEELGDNPLGAYLSIKAKEPSQYASIAKFLEEQSEAQGANAIIDTINYKNNKDIIARLSAIIDVSSRVGVIVTVVFVLASVLITFNTIRLAIYTAREEIGVMRLVGASNLFARGPYVVEGVIYGVFAAILVLVLFWPITYWLGPQTQVYFGNIDIFQYYIREFPFIFFVTMGSGIVLGAFSSWLAVRKYLTV